MYEDFEAGMKNWWGEGGKNVSVENGHLVVDTDVEDFDKGKNGGVCTVWCKTPLSGDVQVDFDVHVISSKVTANNINLFLHYSDPSGKSLYETRESRNDANYPRYHKLDGYIFTSLMPVKDNKPASDTARFRIRRCPGFKLLNQSFQSEIRKGITYHMTIIKQGTELSILLDGKLMVTASDPNPLSSGLLGLRTYRTKLWWDNIRVKQL